MWSYSASLTRRSLSGIHKDRLGSMFRIGARSAEFVTRAASLRSPQQPIGDPFFPILEILIILSAPLIVALMVAGLPWFSLLFSFTWPSVPYALDILAWDLFFGLSMLFAAPVFRGDRLRTSIRLLMIVSGVLALGGLSGAVVGDMQLRMIGVVGYAGVFPVVTVLLTIVFWRSKPVVTVSPPVQS